nr:type II toxin-antitoxin system HigB family toxin [Burkholderia ubonensis]
MTSQDIWALCSSVSLVGRNRVDIQIEGNDSRLIMAVIYRIGVVYIECVGTHGEYDRIDAKTVEQE